MLCTAGENRVLSPESQCRAGILIVPWQLPKLKVTLFPCLYILGRSQKLRVTHFHADLPLVAPKISKSTIFHVEIPLAAPKSQSPNFHADISWQLPKSHPFSPLSVALVV